MTDVAIPDHKTSPWYDGQALSELLALKRFDKNRLTQHLRDMGPDTMIPIKPPRGKPTEAPLIGALALAKLRHHKSDTANGHLFGALHKQIEDLLKPEVHTPSPNSLVGSMRLGGLLRLAVMSTNKFEDQIAKAPIWEALNQWDPIGVEDAYDDMFTTYAELMNDRSADRRLAIDIQIRFAISQRIIPPNEQNALAWKGWNFSDDFLNRLLTAKSSYQADVWRCLASAYSSLDDSLSRRIDLPQITSDLAAVIHGMVAVTTFDTYTTKVFERALETIALPADTPVGAWPEGSSIAKAWPKFKEKNEGLVGMLIDRQRAIIRQGQITTHEAPTASRRRPRG